METDDLYVFQNKCLTVMGETLDVSRIYIFEHHHETDTMDNAFEWVAEGVLPQKDEKTFSLGLAAAGYALCMPGNIRHRPMNGSQ